MVIVVSPVTVNVKVALTVPRPEFDCEPPPLSLTVTVVWDKYERLLAVAVSASPLAI